MAPLPANAMFDAQSDTLIVTEPPLVTVLTWGGHSSEVCCAFASVGQSDPKVSNQARKPKLAQRLRRPYCDESVCISPFPPAADEASPFVLLTPNRQTSSTEQSLSPGLNQYPRCRRSSCANHASVAQSGTDRPHSTGIQVQLGSTFLEWRLLTAPPRFFLRHQVHQHISVFLPPRNAAASWGQAHRHCTDA